MPPAETQAVPARIETMISAMFMRVRERLRTPSWTLELRGDGPAASGLEECFDGAHEQSRADAVPRRVTDGECQHPVRADAVVVVVASDLARRPHAERHIQPRALGCGRRQHRELQRPRRLELR